VVSSLIDVRCVDLVSDAFTDSSKRFYHLDDAQYKAKILAPVVKLFASPDRGARMALLDSLPEYETRLDGKTVQDGIWPHLVRIIFSNCLSILNPVL
jgi:SCY1-like protein 1